MLKISTFLAESEQGRSVFPLFGKQEAVFEKTAAPSLKPEVLNYIDNLRPRKDAQYVLVNALGAGEYFGSNVNGDFFNEAGLIHKPTNWTGNPLIDKPASKSWAYGFPTFYNAHPYAHHKNKDSSRAYGEVELAVWNDAMKRVELVARVDHEKCVKFGGMSVWDRLVAGQFADVSMGSRVPYDLCSITLDKKLYQKALATFNPAKHKHPGAAALEFHKKLKAEDGVGIRGLSITRKDYSKYCLEQMNVILPDGKKVWVYNDYPNFFDISFVFIGADRTAKVMVYISRINAFIPSAFEAEKLGYAESEPEVKLASIQGQLLQQQFKKASFGKWGELDKEIAPNLPPGKAIPALTRNEPHLPDATLDLLSSLPLRNALSTAAGIGIILRPAEFQKVLLNKLGKGELAKRLAESKAVFPQSEEETPIGVSEENFHPGLARILMPHMASRSGLGPIIQHRVVMIETSSPQDVQKTSSLSDDLLRKMGAAYNGYRKEVMGLVDRTQEMIKRASGSNDDLQKLASISDKDFFTPLSFHYFSHAFLDEIPVEVKVSAITGANVQRANPSRNTRN